MSKKKPVQIYRRARVQRKTGYEKVFETVLEEEVRKKLATRLEKKEVA